MRKVRSLARLLTAGAVALTLILATPVAALALPTPPAAPNWNELFNPDLGVAQDGFPVCLDVPNGSTSSGTQIQMYHCHGYASNGAPQRWTFLHVQDNVYEIDNYWGSGKCLTPNPAGDPANFDVPIMQEPCGISASQEWTMLPVSNAPDYFYLQNYLYPSRCLYASGGPHRNNALVALATCEFEAVEVWALG